jgi:outer membrane lipoprotein-sorting protein
MKQRTRELGFGHVGLLLGIIILCGVILVGGIIWKKHQNQPTVSPELKTALANAPQCSSESDPDLCKFFISFNVQKYTTVSFSDTFNGNNDTGTYQTDNTNKYHIAITERNGSYEIIGIGTTLYSKDTDGNSWWKEKVPLSEVANYNSATDSALVFTAQSSSKPQTTYKRQDNGTCSNHPELTCLKYQVTDPGSGMARFIWFDTTNYQLQRVKTVASNGNSDATFGYAKANISAPSPTKDLPSNKYIVPGQSKPVALPEGASWDSSAGGLIQQYQNSQ